MTAFSHKLIHNSITQSKASRPQMTAKFHTGRLLHRTQYARSRWCVVHFTPLHCNNFELTIHLMIVGLLSTALFQYLKCQDQRVSENGRPTVKALSYSAVHEISEGSLFFTFSLPGGAARTPAARSVTPLLTRFSKNFIFEGFFLNDSAGHWKCCGGPYAARGPAVGPHWLNQNTLLQSSFYTLRGLLYMQACGNIQKFYFWLQSEQVQSCICEVPSPIVARKKSGKRWSICIKAKVTFWKYGQ